MRRLGTLVLATFVVMVFGSILAINGVAADNSHEHLRDGWGTVPKATAARPQLPSQRYGVAMAYYSVRGNLKSRLTLNNKGPNDLPAQVTLYGRDGRRFSADEMIIEGHTFADVDLRELVAAAGDGFEDGSLRVSYTGRVMELGSLLTMTNEETGTEWHDLLMYGTGAKSNRLEGVWWLPNQATEARLVVTNASRDETDVTVRFEGTGRPRTETFSLGPWELRVLDFGKPEAGGQQPRDGRVGGISINYTGEPGSVVARGFVSNVTSGYSGVVPLADPAGSKTSKYHAAGVRVLPVEAGDVDTIIVARNIGTAPTTMSGRFQVTNRVNQVTAVELASKVVAPGQTVIIDTRQAAAEVVHLSKEATAGLELEHDSAPGTVVFSAITISRDLEHVFHVPLTDPETLPSSTGGYFWRLEGSRNTLVLLKNMTDEPQRYTMMLRHADGVWSPGLQTLAPNESKVWDIGSLRSGQVPDAKGRRIPMSAAMGQVQWSIGGGGSPRGMVGRIEQVDYALGVSATYACPQPTNNMFDSAWISPSSTTIQVGWALGFEAWEQDVDAWEEPVDTYEITEILDWDTGNQSVADIVGYPADVGGIANGSTSVNAYGESNGWVDIENTEHAWISEFANVQVQQCPNDATRSAVRQEYVDHQAGHTNFFAGGLPSCSDFSSSRAAAYFGFNEINTGDYGVALVRAPLIAASSTGYGLDKWRENYGSARTINSAFRNPVRNTIVGGAPGNSVSGAGALSGSRHMYGDAADLNNETAGGGSNPNDVNDPANAARLAEWTAMITAAQNAGADWTEPASGPCKLACAHADWRSHGGGYQ